MRKFLVLFDDTHESLNAMRFAAMRAAGSDGGVMILSVIPADDIQHGFGVADVMRAEAQERIEAHFEVFARWMRSRPKVEPELIIREGNPADELMNLIASDSEIGVVVVGISSDKSAANPILNRLLREASNLPCPITVVPDNLSKERLEAIT